MALVGLRSLDLPLKASPTDWLSASPSNIVTLSRKLHVYWGTGVLPEMLRRQFYPKLLIIDEATFFRDPEVFYALTKLPQAINILLVVLVNEASEYEQRAEKRSSKAKEKEETSASKYLTVCRIYLHRGRPEGPAGGASTDSDLSSATLLEEQHTGEEIANQHTSYRLTEMSVLPLFEVNETVVESTPPEEQEVNRRIQAQAEGPWVEDPMEIFLENLPHGRTMNDLPASVGHLQQHLHGGQMTRSNGADVIPEQKHQQKLR
ncbi:uncharacterized protein BO66DRAFT_434084 [Aspergillus aculeatinus CBS 121060]|uniref:Uncharacterized protein n=1 Tax=Aspergillus aculeatinus CBS 121060 TaxID=1448322 RepID=A0ACD1HMS1_9EURO|nr:hypothetical protein BO66DRAFT_434084 [Aspergillus aculeatinus CBS 121060]RAH74977.1 hypothetical protein BO66DRAFT_434084 [Aspergillus aculeatinus CBS 121060]